MAGFWLAALVGLVTLGATAASAAAPPRPYGATPSERQWRHHALETYAFLHFTTNTFTDREWGLGDESPDVFAPTDFDPDQIVLALKAGGMKGAILTCKHHDGFCLWPTATTTHSVASSRWKQGQGELLTHYGPISEVWFDGANGEGPNGKRQVYDWPRN